MRQFRHGFGFAYAALRMEVASIMEESDFLYAVAEASAPNYSRDRAHRTRINRLKTEAAMRAAATRAYTR